MSPRTRQQVEHVLNVCCAGRAVHLTVTLLDPQSSPRMTHDGYPHLRMEEILSREVKVGEQRLRADSGVRLPGFEPGSFALLLPVSGSCNLSVPQFLRL